MKQFCNGFFPSVNINCWKIFVTPLLLVLFSSSLFSQNSIRVAGIVKDNKGIGIAGVSVTIKGSSTGTVTDNTGAYSLEVPSRQTVLVFSYVGYTEVSQTVGNRRAIDII